MPKFFNKPKLFHKTGFENVTPTKTFVKSNLYIFCNIFIRGPRFIILWYTIHNENVDVYWNKECFVC